MFKPVVVQRCCIVAAAVVSIGAAPATRSRPVDLTTVKQDLAELRTAEEKYFSDHNSYTGVVSALELTVHDSVTIKFTEFKPAAYSVSGTVKGKAGTSCVMFIGGIAAIPKTEKGVSAKAEGEILCDGDPPEN